MILTSITKFNAANTNYSHMYYEYCQASTLNIVLFPKLNVHQLGFHSNLPYLKFAKYTVCTAHTLYMYTQNIHMYTNTHTHINTHMYTNIHTPTYHKDN